MITKEYNQFCKDLFHLLYDLTGSGDYEDVDRFQGSKELKKLIEAYAKRLPKTTPRKNSNKTKSS